MTDDLFTPPPVPRLTPEEYAFRIVSVAMPQVLPRDHKRHLAVKDWLTEEIVNAIRAYHAQETETR